MSRTFSGSGSRPGFRVAVTAAVLVSLLGPMARGEDAPDSDPDSPVTTPVPGGDGRRTMGHLAANLGRGFLSVYSHQSLEPFLIGGMLSGISSAYDTQVQRNFSDASNSYGKDFETAFGTWSAAAVGGLFIGGRFAHGERFRAATYDMAIAAVVNLTYTEALKEAVRRERPNGENNQSFPSGHASNAFALAAVLDTHYGLPAAIPGYALATAVAVSRVKRNAHWLSDVVAGSTLGFIVGKGVVRVNGGRASDRAAFMITPVLGPHRTAGLAVSVDFR